MTITEIEHDRHRLYLETPRTSSSDTDCIGGNYCLCLKEVLRLMDPSARRTRILMAQLINLNQFV